MKNTALIKGKPLYVLFRMAVLWLLLGLPGIAKAQLSSTGKVFYMSFMEMEARTGGFPDSLLIYITSEKNTTVDIDNPRLTGTKQTISITAGKVNRYSADPGFYYPTGSEFPATDINSKRCLRITAKDPVNVYCLNLELNRSDGTFILPYESIPKAPEFYITSFTPTQFTGGKYMPSEFVVVGMDNSVTVEITPTVRTAGGKTAGTPFTVNLTRGQVYQVQSNTADGNQTNPNSTSGDFTGTRVRVIGGCGKINVLAGMKSVKMPSNACGIAVDHLYTQVFPTNILGRKHVLMPFKDQSKGYYYRVLATKPNTKISIDGTYIGSTKNAGQYYSEDVTSSVARCVTSDSPVYVIQYMKNGGTCAGTTGNNGDPAILIMPDQSQKILKTVVGTATTNNMNKHYLNILVSKNAKSAVKLNGTFIASSSFTDVNCANHAYAQVQVANPSTNTIECDSGLIVVVYGMGQYESYSYCSGALFENLNYDFTMTRTSKCPQVPVNFKAVYTPPVTKVLWDFGDGYQDTGFNVTHKFVKTGSFYVVMKAIVPAACGKPDTNVRSKIIDVKPGPTVNFPDTTTQCAPVLNVTMDAGYSAKFLYKWQDSSTKQTYVVNAQKKVWVRVLDTSTNCVAYDSSFVRRADTIDAKPKFDTTRACQGDNFYSMSDGSKYTGDGYKSGHWSLTVTKGLIIKKTTPRFSYTFDTTGFYDLEYAVKSGKGCVDTWRGKLAVYPMPKVQMWAGKTEVCQKENAAFRDSSISINGIGKSYWIWGDGTKKDTITGNLNAFHRFPNYDTFSVRLITETINGCRDTADSSFIVHPLPIPKIQPVTNNVCFKQNSYTYTDSSKIPYGSWTNSWTYNKTIVAHQAKLTSISYPDSGNFIVTLRDTSNLGCIDSVKIATYVAPEPKARIQVTDSSKCFNQHFFDFNDNSAIGSGTVASRKWYFTDGTTFNAKTISKKKFTTYGTYTARLVVTSAMGCKDSVTRDIKVLASPMAPFNINNATQCKVGNSFTFTPKNILSVSGVTLAYEWYFGDGNVDAVQSPVYSYADTGTYTVKAIQVTSQGCGDTATGKVSVVFTPKATFTNSPDSLCLGAGKFDFTNTTPFNGTLSSFWRLGDGTTATTSTVSQKNYTSAGNYTVKLVVSTPSGCKDSTTKVVKVFAVPAASFTVNNLTQCLTGNSFVFGNNTNEFTATGVNYVWQFTPGSSITTKTIANQTMPDTGSYLVTLTATSDRGCTSNTSKTLYVAENPVVNSISGSDACQGEQVDFSANVGINSGTITTYSWTFGDGGTSSNSAPSHTYGSTGTFNVGLTVTSDKGCTGTAGSTFPVTIHPLPKPSYIPDYLLSKGMQTDWKFTFNGTPTDPSDNYSWWFEDGQTDYTAGPVLKSFTDTGWFKTKLVMTTSYGCQDSFNKLIFLKPELLLHIPTSFTPNQDGLNEYFGPVGTFGLSSYRMEIFDRWGGMIFKTTDPNNGWDGTDKNKKELPEGVYAWSISFRYIDGKIFVYKGTVTLMR
ncbi:MAG: PKD domain-containing protein [Bacteroidetes bacterium]|nr:PKD domain-containing protein [Bacteroidota bacterium]